jgi:poly [ADP-ribose] polymerase
MYEQADGSFTAQYGRIKGTEVTHSYSMYEWDKIHRSKVKKGYNDVTHLYTEAVAVQMDAAAGDPVKTAVIQNAMVKQLMDDLQGYANKTVKANYTVSQDDVTQAQVDAAQVVINDINKVLNPNVAIKEINDKLLKLYTIIPRKMDNVRNHLITAYSTKSEIEKVNKRIDEEQKLLDTMAGQVLMIRKQKEANITAKDPAEAKKTMDLLEVLGLSIEEANTKEIEIIKKMMGPNANQFRKAFKVINKKTDVKFSKYVDNAKNKKTEMFWHGSRNENWFNILQTGLLIRPSGAVHTGSMFGDGIYGANKAQKSVGYTSLSGAYWSKGNAAKAYLALFDFHVGKQKDITHHNSDCYTLNKSKLAKDGYDSVYAHGGADLRNDEFIVYDADQVTVRFIIEISN